MRIQIHTVLALALVLSAARARAVDDPWADSVVSYTPGASALLTDASKVVGEPAGGGPSTPNNDAIVSLGSAGGRIVLKFSTPVTDDPNNPFGLDCIVYGNAFWTGGNPQVKFQEPGLIEISEDVNENGIADDPWYLIPGSRGYAYSPFPSVTEADGQGNSESAPYILAGNIRNPNILDANLSNDLMEYNWGYADMTPSMTPYLDNYVRPDNPNLVGLTARSGGGDAFDIAWAVDASGKPAGITKFSFIRITSFVTRNYGALGMASPEIDAVADVAPSIDTDGDGILDEYEVRVAGTDPTRSESTILALEIPPLEGGSAYGTLLGTAQDSRGSKLRLYAAQQRTDSGRAYSAKVDILEPSAPGASLPQPNLIKSGCVRQIVSSESDFVAAGVQKAEVTMQYRSSDIAGLDETALQPYLFAGGAYTQSGISDVQVNAPANLVTFRTQYAGLFVLASTAGAGDTGSTEGPQGAIALAATPLGLVADPTNVLHVTSGSILNNDSSPVTDGTLISVSVSRGTILAADVASSVPGVQVATASSAISFDIQAPAQSGSVLITATSVEGAAYGDTSYTFLPGMPAPTVSWTMGRPQEDGTVTVTLTSSVVRDARGNVVRDGTELTLDIADATVTSGDANLDAPGTQVLTTGGRAVVTVVVASDDSVFGVSTYADEAQTVLLGQGHYSPAQYVPMPLRGVVLLVVFIIVAFALRRRRAFRCECT